MAFDRNDFGEKGEFESLGLRDPARPTPPHNEVTRKMLKTFLKNISPKFQMFTGVHELRKGNAIVQAAEYDRLKAQVRTETPENIALSGYKVYSQTDEDGIIDAIFRKIPNNRTFVEIGVQSGVECNSLLLLLKDWRGVWIEGSEHYCRKIEDDLGAREFPHRFRVTSSFVTKDNIVQLLRDSIGFLGVDELDFFSLDIDGNDRHVLEELITSGVRPKVLCVEYNAKFPPPVAVTIRYSATHVWDQSDYMGSSLQSFVDLLTPLGYRLVTCNIPGINAFFVREDLAHHFRLLDVEQLYQPFRIYLSPIVPAQPPSLGYLRERLMATAPPAAGDREE